MTVGSVSHSASAFAAQAIASSVAVTPQATQAVDVSVHPANPGQRYDVSTGRFYVVFRDRQTGQVQFSLPSPNSVAANARLTPAPSSSTGQTAAPQSSGSSPAPAAPAPQAAPVAAPVVGAGTSTTA